MQNISKSMTLKELEFLIAEGAPLIEGRRIAAFSEVSPSLPAGLEGSTGPDLFVLILEDEENLLLRVIRLLISLTAGLNYMLISPRRQRRPKKNACRPFVRSVDAAIKGGRVEEIALCGRDRVAVLSIEGSEGSGFSLVAELFGRHGNLVLLDGSQRILAAFRENDRGSRIIKPGRPYPPPPPGPARPRSAASRALRFGPLASAEGESPFPPESAGSLVPGIKANWTADLLFRKLEEERILDAAKRSLNRKISRLRKRTLRKISSREKLLDEAGKAEEYRMMGDLLKTHFHRLAKGMDRIEVPNVFSGGPKRVAIPLDPARDPAANLESFYRRYRKLKGGIPHLKKLIAGDRRFLAVLEGIAAETAGTDSLEELARLAAECSLAEGAEPGGASRGPSSPSSSRKGDEKRGKKENPGVRRFRAPGGRLLIVGRSGEANHEILKIARGRDIWLHCHDTPGAHVIIPLERGETAPLDALVAAGLLALHFSKRRGAEGADVIYTERKHVRPVKGGRKGRVIVERFKTLHIKSEPDRLEEILEGAEK